MNSRLDRKQTNIQTKSPGTMSNQNAYWDAPSSRWDTGLRWAGRSRGQLQETTMAIIAINISNLPIADKLVKGQDIITKARPIRTCRAMRRVLAAFTTAQAALTAANAAYEESRQQARKAAGRADTPSWRTGYRRSTSLAGFHRERHGWRCREDRERGLRRAREPAPPQPVAQVENVKVSFTGMPGHSVVRWKRDTNADAYVVERSPDPITATSWEDVGTVTEAKYEGNGTIPGQQVLVSRGRR